MSAAPTSERAHQAQDRRAWWGGLLLLGIAIVVAFFTLQGAAGHEKGTLVRAAPVARGTIISRVRAQGKIRARRQAQVGSEIGGRVIAIFTQEGDQVEVGDPLFALDDQQHQNAVAQLEVAMRSARALLSRAELLQTEAIHTHDRDLMLRKKNVIPEEQVRASRMRVALAQADIESSSAGLARTRLDLARTRAALAKTRVRAPIAGTVIAVGLEVGQVVGAITGGGGLGLGLAGSMGGGTSLGAEIVIADLRELVAELEVDELDIARVEVDQPVILRVQGDVRDALSGRVERSGLFGRESGGAVIFAVVAAIIDVDRADGGSRPLTLVEEGPPTGHRLRPGMTVTAEIEVQRLEETISVHLAAVLEAEPGRGKASDRVFVVEKEGAQKIARRRSISLGPSERDRVSVLAGLQVGDVLIEGPYRALRELRDGDPISLADDLASAINADLNKVSRASSTAAAQAEASP